MLPGAQGHRIRRKRQTALRMEGPVVLAEAAAMLDETEVMESRPVDSRSELMDNIKSQNFKLRRLSINPFDRKAVVARQAEAGLDTSAAAILEKAKQRRLAMEGDSDDSDVSDDDDDW